ncbi:GNAT family N-acetyltransferase [Romboutsia sp.]|uniref:GNAT family N-acetyltransferase n=1 Tax=Romboutsia sp. TaxID=1965302 RepID=UPI002C0B36AE|nr:GNAT family N-acetyltransferase [Romboutsia sp.]HSQ87244.1 GNAT family N-acetyltransferase [Romboutsia sp.]
MVRKLSEQDRKLVLEYVGNQPNINLFIIGDIEQFGFESDFQEVWGKFDNQGNLKAILLRYTNNFIPYYEDINEDLDCFKEIISSYPSPKVVSGKSDLLHKFKNIFKSYKEKSAYFCEIKDANNLVTWDDTIKVAKGNDAEKIYDLLETIEEFSDTVNDKEMIKDRLEGHSGRAYYIENDKGEMVSIAQTTAENSKSAMVVGVATKVGYRENGYMSKCLSRLCNDVLKEGKTLCLFYDNPKAGKIYHKIGFKEIGRWTMLVER